MTSTDMRAEEFKKIYKRTIKREGAGELLAWLETTDFFTAPAGAKHHGAYPGGLVAHSINVYDELCTSIYHRQKIKVGSNKELLRVSEESMAICALLHDVCKADFYALEYRNQKNEAGVWERVPVYKVKDRFPMGHGEKSVYLISRHMKLTDVEALAIRWHMGAWDNAVKGGDRAMDDALDFHPLVLMLQQADERAAREERRQEAESGNQV